jgi:hypothetical protein
MTAMFDHKAREMTLNATATALVFTDLHNDFLSPQGKAFGLIKDSLAPFSPGRSEISASNRTCGTSSSTASKSRWFATPGIRRPRLRCLPCTADTSDRKRP